VDRRRPSGHRILDHTSEVAFRAWGRTLCDAFAEAGKALFSVMVDLRGVRAREWMDIDVQATGPNDLLVEWLNELVFRSDVENMLLSRFKVQPFGEHDGHLVLHARCCGEPYDSDRHRAKLQVKAASYSNVSVRKTENGWTVEGVLDV